MKSNLGLLLKIQFMRLCNPAFFKSNSDNKKKNRILLTLVGGIFLSAVMIWYSGMIAYGYVQIGQVFVIPRMMVGTCALLLVFLTFIQSSGALFGSGDFDMVMSLPVKAYQVVLAKILSFYVVGLFAHVILLAPAFFMYATSAEVGAGDILSMVLLIFTAPILPTVLALALGTLIVVITSRLPHRQFFTLVLSIGGTLLVVVWAMGFSTKGVEELTDMGKMISDMIGRIYPPAVWAVSYLEGRGMGEMFGFILGSAALLALLVALVSRFYIPVNSAIASLKRRQVKKVRSKGASSVFAALIRKELHRLTSSTIYAMNTTIGLLLMIIAGIAVVVTGPSSIEKALNMPGVLSQMKGVLPLFLALMAAMSPTTAPSLSLEGKSRWIMCSLPVEPIKILQAKIALNLILLVPSVLFGGVCFYIAFRPQGISAVLLFIVPLAYGIFAAVFGMFANVKFPSYDWTHEQQAVKNSMSVMMSVLGGMAVALVPLFLEMRFPAYGDAVCAAAAVVVLVVAAGCYVSLKKVKLYV